MMEGKYFLAKYVLVVVSVFFFFVSSSLLAQTNGTHEKNIESLNSWGTFTPYESTDQDKQPAWEWTPKNARTIGDLSPTRFLSVDRFADKFPSLTPYQYAANNPILFIDVNGDSIWINYNDADGNSQRLLYTSGMTFNGDNQSVAALVNTLNSISSSDLGGAVLNRLVGSTGNYNVAFGGLSDTDAAGAFRGATNGLGGNFSLDSRVLGNVQKISHEFFHGYQQDLGSGGASVFNEVQANLFGASVADATGNMFVLFGVPGTQAGQIHGNMMTSVLTAPNFIDANAQFYSAVSTFLAASRANRSGLYSRHNIPIRRTNQRILINRFYPLLR